MILGQVQVVLLSHVVGLPLIFSMGKKRVCVLDTFGLLSLG